MSLSRPASVGHFKVEIQDAVVGRFAECSGLSVEYEVLPYEEGGENRFVHQLRGRMRYPNIVLKRGVTDEKVFLDWLFQRTDRDRRGTLTITMFHPDSATARRWSFASARPVKWSGPTLNAGSSSIATEMLEIAHDGLLPE